MAILLAKTAQNQSKYPGDGRLFDIINTHVRKIYRQEGNMTGHLFLTKECCGTMSVHKVIHRTFNNAVQSRKLDAYHKKPYNSSLIKLMPFPNNIWFLINHT